MNHTEYFIITNVSDYTVNSTISLYVTDYSHVVRCVSNNDAGRVHQNLTIIHSSSGENGKSDTRQQRTLIDIL